MIFKKGITEKDALQALSNVKDPDLGRDIVSLGFIKNMKIDKGDIQFDLELTTPACPVKEQLKQECELHLKKLDGVEKVSVNLTSRVRQGGPVNNENLKGVKNLLAVASGKGGVGKSTVAVNLAMSLKKTGATVGLMDADIYGPSMPTMFGVSEKPNVDGDKQMIHPVEKYGIKLISMGFLLNDDSPVIWRGPMVSGITQQFLNQVIWGDLDYLVIDLPPGTGDIQLTLTQQAPLTGAVIVTTPQEASVIDARRGLKMFEQVNVPVLGVVENMSYFICDGCEKKHHIFKKGGGLRISHELDVPFLGNIPMESAIADGGDSGKPITMSDESSPATKEYSALAGKVAASLSIIKEGGALKEMTPFPVEVENGDGSGFNIVWSDGHQGVYNNKTVRANCQCASCIDEWSGDPILDADSIPADIHYKSYNKIGQYALAFSWSDGHDTGIYSFGHLRNLCACDLCAGNGRAVANKPKPAGKGAESCGSHACSCGEGGC